MAIIGGASLFWGITDDHSGMELSLFDPSSQAPWRTAIVTETFRYTGGQIGGAVLPLAAGVRGVSNKKQSAIINPQFFPTFASRTTLFWHYATVIIPARECAFRI